MQSKTILGSGPTVYSDCWHDYNTDEEHNASFNHLTVNHTYIFIYSQISAHIQNVEWL